MARGQTRKTAEASDDVAVAEAAPVHNLLGQRLGKKGRETHERILAAAQSLLADPRGAPLSLSAVAREASLAMTTIYLYFADLTELLLAVLNPVAEAAEEAYVHNLRTRWPDETLGEECQTFIQAFYAFWDKHTRVLHLRNSYAAGLDQRMVQHRVESSSPMIDLLVLQMDGTPGAQGSPQVGMATALLTGMERVVTVITDTDLADAIEGGRGPMLYAPAALTAQARLLELGIRDGRDRAAESAAS